MFAHIIVDVPAFQTDIPYTYKVPEKFQDVLEMGMRVSVPFGSGNRLVVGFFMGFTSQEFSGELKSIESLIDDTPLINRELIRLAKYMAETTFSFQISCLQTMIPAMLRSSYEKTFFPLDETGIAFFEGKQELSSRELEKTGNLHQVLKLKKQGHVDVRYGILSNETVKREHYIHRKMSDQELEDEREKLRKNSLRQFECIDALKSINKPIKRSAFPIPAAVIKTAEEKGWLGIEKRVVNRNPFAGQKIARTEAIALNQEQNSAKHEVVESVQSEKDTVFLLEGVTGSGKTEVYLQVIQESLDLGKNAIVLVPEISLTPQMTERFVGRFGSDVAVLHSGLSAGEKYDEWRKVERGDVKIVVGARSAIFAPLENIGVIILDEEHEATYKQDSAPRYHAREIAKWRAAYHHCPVVLGSATPSLESRARAQKGVYTLLRLGSRAVKNAGLPSVEVLDMRESFGKQGEEVLSARMVKGLQEALGRGEQAILLLNRRGFSSFMMCRDCGDVLKCPNCDISLTLHMDTRTMRCHYCNHEEGIPWTCKNCNSKNLKYYGVGTEQVEELLAQKLPEAKILRMDVDSTRKKGAHQKILEKFESGEAQILLGTQMIAKGLDFENVTFVGVVNADTGLFLPDFRASERTFQLLTQVAGRAGRGKKAGEVLIQSYNPDHYAIQYARTHDYHSFYIREMHIRQAAGYPPFYYTAQITTSHREENIASKAIYDIFLRLHRELGEDVVLMGPSPKSIAKVANQYYFQIILKYKKEERVQHTLKSILEEFQGESLKGLSLHVDKEPQHFV
ncbi:MAG: primosomal protein N' [Streptococcaceae bacterium]|nr:primosomal protein N' [Streptococcaceae bacterium]